MTHPALLLCRYRRLHSVLVLCLTWGAALASLSTAYAQTQIVSAPGGVNLRSKGFVFNSPAIVSPNSLTAPTANWESDRNLQGLAIPAANLTGLRVNGSPMNLEDLLPLKVTKLSLMTGSAGAPPTGIGTLIDADGIETNTLIANAIYLINPATQQPIPLATVQNGAITVHPQAFGSPIVGNLATGAGALVLGGRNDPGQQNLASGVASTIIGSAGSIAAARHSVVIGSPGSEITNLNAHYTAILGGSSHFVNGSTAYSVILGGSGNGYNGVGAMSALIGGTNNIINGGGYYQAIIGGQSSYQSTSNGSVIVGGRELSIEYTQSGWGQNVLAGGHQNRIAPESALSAIIGGQANTLSGWRNTIVAGLNAQASGSDNLVTGWGSIAVGAAQVVVGRYNLALPNAAFIIGGGTSNVLRRNALSVDYNGNVEAAGNVKAVTLEAQSLRLTAPQGNISMGAFTND